MISRPCLGCLLNMSVIFPILEGGKGADLGHLIDIEGLSDLLQTQGCFPRHDAIADAQPGQTIDLGKGPERDHGAAPFGVVDKGNNVDLQILVHKIDIRLIQNNYHRFRNLTEKGMEILVG